MNKVENKPTKTKLVATVVTLIFLVALVVGLTYALFQYNKLGDTDNQMTTGTLVMEIDDQNATAIQLANAYPVTDADGLAQTPYTFTIRNTGDLSAKYRLRLVKEEASYPEGIAKADSSYIKYGFKKDGQTSKIGFVDDNDGILVTDEVLAGGESTTFSLTLWVDSVREIPNTLFDTKNIEFYGRVQLEAIQEGHTDYTTGE